MSGIALFALIDRLCRWENSDLECSQWVMPSGHARQQSLRSGDRFDCHTEQVFFVLKLFSFL